MEILRCTFVNDIVRTSRHMAGPIHPQPEDWWLEARCQCTSVAGVESQPGLSPVYQDWVSGPHTGKRDTWLFVPWVGVGWLGQMEDGRSSGGRRSRSGKWQVKPFNHRLHLVQGIALCHCHSVPLRLPPYHCPDRVLPAHLPEGLHVRPACPDPQVASATAASTD